MAVFIYDNQEPHCLIDAILAQQYVGYVICLYLKKLNKTFI